MRLQETIYDRFYRRVERVLQTRMTRFGLPFMLFILGFQYANAQQDQVKVAIAGRVDEKQILLRIAPTSPSLWQLGNKYGYVVERYTVTRGKQYLGNKEKKILTVSPLKPLPLKQWEALADTNQFAEIAAEALYGETFELATDFNQDIMQVYNKAKELESRFSFALFAADVSVDVAKASGLFITDRDVRKDERYLYRVFSLVPQNVLRSDTGFVYLSMADHAPLPAIRDVKVQFSDRMAMISWDTRNTEKFYSAFWIERSENGKDFKKISDLPYLNVHPENVDSPGVAYKLDSLADNTRTYHYRVIGISMFGEVSPPSDIVKGQGISSLTVAPAIKKVNDLASQAEVQWDFPKESEEVIKGFEVERSNSSEDGYRVISPLLPSNVRRFTDPKPDGTNYYRVKAVGKAGQKAHSFAVLFQLEDSIPPAPPTGLVGYIDTTGLVTIKWNGNTERDLEGYRVFRSSFRNSEFSQVTNTAINAPAFEEKIGLANLTKEIYYKVQAIDNRFNPSGFSKVLKLNKPDKVAPTAPVIQNWKAAQDNLFVKWVPSSSEDVLKHVLRYRGEGQAQWKVAKSFSRSDSTQYRFSRLDNGAYEILIDAVDSAGNATSSKALVVKITGAPKKSVQDVKAVADHTSKKIIVTWKPSAIPASKILIYRAENEGNVTLYKSLAGDSNGFADDRVSMNSQYSYYIKVVFSSGEESVFSQKVSVSY
jgi:uncharacterized protein